MPLGLTRCCRLVDQILSFCIYPIFNSLQKCARMERIPSIFPHVADNIKWLWFIFTHTQPSHTQAHSFTIKCRPRWHKFLVQYENFHATDIQTTGTESGREWWWLRGACCLVPGQCYQLQKTEENNRGPLHDFDLGPSHTPSDISDLSRDLRLLSDFGFRLISGDSVDWEPVVHICWPCCFLIIVMQWPAEARASSSASLSFMHVYSCVSNARSNNNPKDTDTDSLQIQIHSARQSVWPCSQSVSAAFCVYCTDQEVFPRPPHRFHTKYSKIQHGYSSIVYNTKNVYCLSFMARINRLHSTSSLSDQTQTALLTKKQTQTN